LALDEPKDSDNVFDHCDMKYVVDNALMKQAGDIIVDFVDAGWQSGFNVTSAKPLFSSFAAGGACPTGGSCSC
jgi:Fe-S cluster assembly iron-binding protein IscA